jgi:hypothetical protein
MKTGKSMIGMGVLIAAIACGTAPTAVPATALVPTNVAVTATGAAQTPGASASPTGAGITPDSVRTVAAGEVVKLFGNSFTTSDTYRFSADTTLDVSWVYTGTAPFALWLINVSENVTDPKYDRILIDDITGPHSGSAKEGIIAGDWTVQVEQAQGPWTVEFNPES